MDESILYTRTWQGSTYPKPFFVSYIFLLTTTIKFAVSQPSESNCILDIKPSLFPRISSCDGGDWGGFLHNNCCGLAFDGYLYALGQRANQTGQIFLNLTEQRNCLATIKSSEGDILGCGIETLTSGSGGCSDFSVAHVMNRMGDKFMSLKESCEHVSSDGESSQSCGTCARSWEDIGGIHSKNNQSTKVETDICRFAVLVSLTSSRIEDETWVQTVNRCLGEDTNIENQAVVSKRKKKSSKGLWGGLIAGVTGIAIIVAIAIWILSKRWFRSIETPKKDAPKKVLQETPKKVLQETAGCLKVPIKEVYSSTNNLNELNIIGEGTAGKVYKGILSNNEHVAIKHIIKDGDLETFVREVTSLSDVRHQNLVALLGFCEEEDECFLVYELCPNGNLSEWLFGKDKVLSWIQRLEIAIDSARGLWFLHTYPEGCIVHRDIKALKYGHQIGGIIVGVISVGIHEHVSTSFFNMQPSNILLGMNFEAKLSDFGLSKVIDQGESFVSSEVRGTFGYVDPEYQSNRHVNSSGDVYSFGIVLLQILSGKKVINMNVKNPMPLDKMAKVLTRGGSIKEFADPRLEGEYSAKAFALTLKLAMSCTALKRQRPSMEQVVIQLERALDISTRAITSTPQATPDRSTGL